jgi:hypothetical protein
MQFTFSTKHLSCLLSEWIVELFKFYIGLGVTLKTNAIIFYLYPSMFLPCKHKAIRQFFPVVPFMVSQNFSSIQGQIIKMAKTVRQKLKS